MKEIVCVKLENDMDLILAHKRAMKLCELNGFSLVIQTSVATAVSEIARCAIEFGDDAELVLGVDEAGRKKHLTAIVKDSTDFSLRCKEAVQYAKKLVDNVDIVRVAQQIQIVLKHELNFSHTLTQAKLDSFVDYFKREPPLSAYDEMRRKNLLLQELAEKVQKSELDFRVLTDSLPVMMFSANNRSVIKYANKWMQDFLGKVPKELSIISWTTFIHPEDFTRFSKEFSAALSKQIPLKSEYRFKEKLTNNFLWHLMSLIPLRDATDTLSQWTGCIVDINAQKQIEQTLKDNQVLREAQYRLIERQHELQRTVIELNRTNYELEQFAHLASHDLQEPLRKISFYSDVLKKKYATALDGAGVNTLNNMEKAAARMKELINDLLSYSELQKQNLDLEDVNLKTLINEVVKDLDVSVKEKKASIVIGDLPYVQGNPLKLRQLFINLLSNALKYSKTDIRPIIEIGGSINGNSVSITVKDNGIGFEERYKEKIFGLFERLHTKEQFPGTGIGLSICRRIVELHRGAISAFSVPGEYSVFQVSLPVKQELDFRTR